MCSRTWPRVVARAAPRAPARRSPRPPRGRRSSGRLRVDHDCLPPGQPHDEIGAQPAVLGVHRLACSTKSQCAEHARHLDHAAELDLAPAAAHRGARAAPCTRLAVSALQLLLASGQRLDLLASASRRRRRAPSPPRWSFASTCCSEPLDRRDQRRRSPSGALEIARGALLEFARATPWRDRGTTGCCAGAPRPTARRTPRGSAPRAAPPRALLRRGPPLVLEVGFPAGQLLAGGGGRRAQSRHGPGARQPDHDPPRTAPRKNTASDTTVPVNDVSLVEECVLRASGLRRIRR